MSAKNLKIVSQTSKATVDDIVASLVYASRDGHGESVLLGVGTETILLHDKPIEFIVIQFGDKKSVNVPAETSCAPLQ